MYYFTFPHLMIIDYSLFCPFTLVRGFIACTKFCSATELPTCSATHSVKTRSRSILDDTEGWGNVQRTHQCTSLGKFVKLANTCTKMVKVVSSFNEDCCLENLKVRGPPVI